MGTSLKGKNLLPEGADSCLKKAVPYGIENHFYHIKLPSLNVTFTTHVRNGEMEATPMRPPGLIQ